VGGGSGAASVGDGANGGTGGIVTEPVCDGALTSDLFDPNRVYLAGTLSEGSCGADAIVVPECPNSAAVGFDCDFRGNSEVGQRSAQIDPTTGRLLYKNTVAGDAREFHCDACPYLAANANRYPKAVLENDPIVPSPCAGSVGEFLIDPHGSRFFRCSGAWVDEAGDVVHADTESTLAHIGYERLALTRENIAWYTLAEIVDLGTGETAPIVGLPDGNIHAIRAAAPDRFLIALNLDEAARPGEIWELWQIGRAGDTVRLGEYPPFPTEVGPSPGAMLLPDGTLYQIANGPRVVTDVVVRRVLGGTTEVVYSEANEPHVRIHISGLLTGP
jgi:hypothetical protein